MFEENEDEISRILYDDTLDAKTRQMARSVRTMENQLEQGGFDPGDGAPRESFWSSFLDTIDAPRQGVAGVIDTALRGDMFEGDVGFGWQRGQQENTTTSDILRRHDIIENPIARGITGFIGDVLTDPLTYVTFGAGNAAKQGGKVLTESGKALRQSLYSRIAESGKFDVLSSSDKLDDIFRAADRYTTASKVKNATALDAHVLSQAEDVFKGFLSPDELLQAGQIFEPSKLRIGVTIPGLGHLTGNKNLAEEIADPMATALKQDIGPIGQAFKVAGKVFNPGRVNIAEIEASPALLNAVDNVRLYANQSLKTIAERITSIPLIGKPAGAMGKATLDTFGKANKLFQQAFNRKYITGPNFRDAELNLIDARQFAKVSAAERANEILGEFATNKDAQRLAYLAIDAESNKAMQRGAELLDKVDQAELLETINKVKASGEVIDSDIIAMGNLLQKTDAEQVFSAGIEAALQSPLHDDATKEVIRRTVAGLDELAKTEQEAGLAYSRIQNYVPHRYKNLAALESSQAKVSSGKAGGFAEARKYNTISDAFKSSGLVGDTDLLSVLQGRFESSGVLLANKRFFARIAKEEGLPREVVSQLYKEAALDPAGPAAQSLRRYRFNIKPIDTENISTAAYNAELQKIFRNGGDNPEAARILAEHGGEFNQKMHEEAWKANFKPLDSHLPDSLLGEIGEEVSLPGGKGEKIFLPKPLANAFKETIAARDLLKDQVGNSPFGKRMLKVLDHTTAAFKKGSTVFFPAYWGQNFLGDRITQGLRDVSNYDPGVMGRTYNVLAGRSAIRNPAGQILTKQTLDRVAKSMGLNYTVNDYLGTLDAFGDMNIEKHLAKKGSMLENAFKVHKSANRSALLAQLHDKMQYGTDGFFRLNHFVHRFEKGDGISDAVRSAQNLYFNYRDMTPIEQSYFRRFYMFYGYFSKATKQTLSNFITSPGAANQQVAMTRAMAEFFSDPDAAPHADLKDAKLLNSLVTNEELSHVVGMSKDGKPLVGRKFAAPLNAVMQQFSIQMPRKFTIAELLDTAGDSTRRTIQKQFAASNPIINSMAQAISGKNLYFDKPLDAEFLRKLPDLTKAAEYVAGFAHTDIPTDLNDAAKEFLGARPDGQGRLIVNPSKMWILVNLIPGLSRAISTAGMWSNEQMPNSAAALRTLAGVNIDDADPSRSMLASRQSELRKFMDYNSVKERVKERQEDE